MAPSDRSKIVHIYNKERTRSLEHCWTQAPVQVLCLATPTTNLMNPLPDQLVHFVQLRQGKDFIC